MRGLEPVAFGDLGIAGLAAVEHAAFGEKLGPGRPMDRAIDAAPAKERRIGGVDDGVNAERRDVSNDDVELAPPIRRVSSVTDQAATATPFSEKSCCNSPAWNISRMMSQPPTNSPFT